MLDETIVKLRDGDHCAFNTVYDEWSRKVFFYFFKKTNSDISSQELTQEVFIKLWKYRDSLSIEHTIDQQLFQKARLIYIDWLRMEATQRKHFASSENLHEEQLSPVESTIEIQQHLQHSINTLSPQRKKVFELKHVYGYSYKEIANYLGITVKTVDNHLLKATSHLRKVFHL